MQDEVVGDAELLTEPDYAFGLGVLEVMHCDRHGRGSASDGWVSWEIVAYICVLVFALQVIAWMRRWVNCLVWLDCFLCLLVIWRNLAWFIYIVYLLLPRHKASHAVKLNTSKMITMSICVGEIDQPASNLEPSAKILRALVKLSALSYPRPSLAYGN